MATKRKTKTKLGRPSNGIDEVRILVPMPALLAGVAEELARREGISRAEWIRRAMGRAMVAKSVRRETPSER